MGLFQVSDVPLSLVLERREVCVRILSRPPFSLLHPLFPGVFSLVFSPFFPSYIDLLIIRRCLFFPPFPRLSFQSRNPRPPSALSSLLSLLFSPHHRRERPRRLVSPSAFQPPSPFLLSRFLVFISLPAKRYKHDAIPSQPRDGVLPPPLFFSLGRTTPSSPPSAK